MSPAPPALSVLVPCFNEAANLSLLCDGLKTALDTLSIDWEVVLIDDGSLDDTWVVMQRVAAKHSFVVIAQHDQNRGMVNAWRTAAAIARAEIVCVIDADLQYAPSDVPRLLHARAVHGVEFAQGARRFAGTVGLSRYWISRGLNTLLNLTFGMSLPDNKSGFFVCRRAVFLELLSFRKQYHAWQNLIMVAAWAHGHRSVSVETEFRSRHAGQSFLADMPVRHMALSLRDIIVALGEYGRLSSL